MAPLHSAAGSVFFTLAANGNISLFTSRKRHVAILRFFCDSQTALTAYTHRRSTSYTSRGVQHRARGPEAGPPGVSIRPTKPTRPTDRVEQHEKYSETELVVIQIDFQQIFDDFRSTLTS